MNQDQEKRLFTLFQGHSADSLSEGDHAELQAMLRSDAEARELWFVHQDVEVGLRSGLLVEPRKVEVTMQNARRPWISWRPVAAAAAGLVIGAFSASMVWAVSAGKSWSAGERELPLVDGGFEQSAGDPPLYMSRKFGVWAGDPVEIVPEFEGIKPHSGQRMGRYMASAMHQEYRSLSNASDLWQTIPLSGSGTRVVRVRAWFAAIGPASFTIGAVAGAGGSETANTLWNARIKEDASVLAAGLKTVSFSGKGDGWQMAEVLMEVPDTARVLVIDVAAHRMPDAKENDGFPGQFVDDVSVTISDVPDVP